MDPVPEEDLETSHIDLVLGPSGGELALLSPGVAASCVPLCLASLPSVQSTRQLSPGGGMMSSQSQSEVIDGASCDPDGGMG